MEDPTPPLDTPGNWWFVSKPGCLEALNQSNWSLWVKKKLVFSGFPTKYGQPSVLFLDKWPLTSPKEKKGTHKKNKPTGNGFFSPRRQDANLEMLCTTVMAEAASRNGPSDTSRLTSRLTEIQKSSNLRSVTVGDGLKGWTNLATTCDR